MSLLEPTLLDLLTIGLLKENHEDIAFFSGGLAYRILYKLIKSKTISSVQLTWNLLTSSGAILMGILLYKEKLDEKKIAGLGLGLFSIYLLN
jgi:multidrug transporter EmrE-like cation transporter